MILLPVDPAYAFDYLSILYVKRDSGLPVELEINRVETFVSQQLPVYDDVLKSMAFKRLMVANQKTFDAIELAHKNAISARDVQRINLLRFEAKKRLQSEFWPSTRLMETKTKIGRKQRLSFTR